MAANFWTSTHRKYWSFTTDGLADTLDELNKQHEKLIQQHPYPDRRLMFIFLRDRLLQLGRRLPFRQQCVATALVYMHRYFLTNPMQNVNLYLLTSTAFYLASKTEESPHHIRLVAAEARQAWPEFVPSDVSRLGELEFCLISEMHSQLIIWHPYRTLLDLKDDPKLKLSNDEVNLAWCIINDSYMTDLPLTCSPHLIAVIAIFLAIIFAPTTKPAPMRAPGSLDVSMTTDMGPFGTIGGRAGMTGTMGNSIHNLSMQAPFSMNVAGSHRSNGAGAQLNTDMSKMAAPDKAKAIQSIQNSDKFQNAMKFLIESDIDLHRIIDGTQEIISLYEVWELYNEKNIKEAVSRCIKSNAFDA